MQCPKCGGITGYNFFVVSKQLWHGDWNKPTEMFRGFTNPKENFVEAIRDDTAKTITCIDCGHRLKRTALGIMSDTTT